jgi:hypothetical protein
LILRLVVMLVLAVIVGAVIWPAVRGGGSPTTTSVVSEKGLQKLVANLGQPVYWVGPQTGVRYELDHRSNGQILVRYLSGTEKPGAAEALAVGTYPMTNAYGTTVALGKKKGWQKLDTGTGGVTAFINTVRPYSTFFALPGVDYQVEVYDPKPGFAAEIVKEGRAVQVVQGERLGLTLSGLEKKVASLGRSVYWIGPRQGVTYEYTGNPNGNVYIRYLTRGAAVGSTDTYPTVGTYPMKKAFDVTKSNTSTPGVVRVKVAGGAAFYRESSPASVFIAFKGSDYQIEVYSPTSGQALAAVRSGEIKPIG